MSIALDLASSPSPIWLFDSLILRAFSCASSLDTSLWRDLRISSSCIRSLFSSWCWRVSIFLTFFSLCVYYRNQNAFVIQQILAKNHQNLIHWYVKTPRESYSLRFIGSLCTRRMKVICMVVKKAAERGARQAKNWFLVYFWKWECPNCSAHKIDLTLHL